MENEKSIDVVVEKMLSILGFEVVPCKVLTVFGNTNSISYFKFHRNGCIVAFCDCNDGFWLTSFAAEATKATDNICCGIRPTKIFNKLTSFTTFKLIDINSHCYCTFKNPFYGCTSIEECLIRIDLRCGHPMDYSKLQWIHFY